MSTSPSRLARTCNQSPAIIVAFVVAILLLWVSTALSPATAATAPEEGFDYWVLASPQATRAGGKPEVIEFFWYDCPHCNAMMPLIEPWAKRQRNRIIFKRVPVARNEAAILQQQLYYALENLGKVEALHGKIFYAIHDEWIPLKTIEQMADFLETQGIEKKQFLKTFNSDAVMKRVKLAQELTKTYHVDSVPTIAINGQYVTSASLTGGSQADALQVAEYLISKSRSRQP